MAEWSKALAWKASERISRSAGSNPALSAKNCIEICRARWGTSGALYLQSATAGSKAYHEAIIL